MVDPRRVRVVGVGARRGVGARHGVPQRGVPQPVIYWVNRERRAHDNWALLYAQEQALAHGVPLRVVFCLVPEFLGATLRQYDFMLRGLAELEADLAAYNIPLTVLLGTPKDVLVPFINTEQPSLLVTDFEPLRIKKQWIADVAIAISAPFYQVDAHNIVPCWEASTKLEFAAYTIRPKIVRQLPKFLTEFPQLQKQGASDVIPSGARNDWSHIRTTLRINTNVKPVDWLVPGERAAREMLQTFVSRLHTYADRNDPTVTGQSNLSPYLHFGQISAQRIALDVMKAINITADRITEIQPLADGFLEELIVRRELADNFTEYNDNYDRFEGFHSWAQETLNVHRSDVRAHTYTLEQWERAETHDELWNAAQREMMQTGKMHGFMRMYWAKKILEWTSSPDEALAIAIHLNDTYELDGRDPNGYTGIAWSIGGVHDRAWTERPVYGKIRYMNANGCRRKFDVDGYIRRF
ncbi:MAG: deoxyribodipyrimidine photo-lyase [Ignavibacteriae bacterium]|nr:MAG: deoxyribodipyrimidine photo-lyase [Ignavibacteriota bacterium]